MESKSKQHYFDHDTLSKSQHEFGGWNSALYVDAMNNEYQQHSNGNVGFYEYGLDNDHLIEITTVLLGFIGLLVFCIGSNVVIGIGAYFLGRRSMKSRARENDF